MDPIPELEAWSQRLRQIASAPLEHCEDFPAIARRYEAWWACDVIDRPILIASADSNPARPIQRRLELLDRPEAWFEAKRADMLQLHRVGDKLPTLRVDFGPVMLGGLLGGEVEFVADTTWTHSLIRDDWANEPDWRIVNEHWWRLMQDRFDQAAEYAAGRCIVTAPALGGAGDVLLNLRGASELALDVIERPERITRALDGIYTAWRQAWSEGYRRTVERGAGIMRWANLWSDRPYCVTECDFNYMIGPKPFERLFLPDIARAAATAGRSIFHLDGPGATRHIDALLSIPELQAIQYVPGAGTPSALKWVELLRKIQRAGKALQVICPPDEVLPLCDELRPEGLALWSEGVLPPDDLDDLFDRFCKRYT
jgi:hypothetical protein